MRGDSSKLRDDPLPERDAQLPWRERTPDETPVELVRRIKGMLVGDEFAYAEDTLRGILDTVERTKRCTSRQVDAVDHIANAPHRGEQHGGNRRWGGW